MIAGWRLLLHLLGTKTIDSGEHWMDNLATLFPQQLIQQIS